MERISNDAGARRAAELWNRARVTNDPELDDAATPAELETMAAQDYSTLPLGFPTC